MRQNCSALHSSRVGLAFWGLQKSEETYAQLVGTLQLAFPHHNDFPPGLLERTGKFLVALDIACEFCFPKLYVALGHIALFATCMPMPKAAMNENDGTEAPKNDVGFSGKRFGMEPETETGSMKHRANSDFRRSVSALDAAHVPTAPTFIETIHLFRNQPFGEDRQSFALSA